MNYFELFQLPHHPAVDKALINKKYRELQRQYHPDFFTQADENSMNEALEKSAAVNKAYNIFSSPEKTIAYFLETQGLIAENEKYNLPPEFLMEMMELNESIAEQQGTEAGMKINAFEQELQNEIAPILVKKTMPDTTEMEMLKAYYYKKKYLKRILDRLDD